MHIAPPSPRHHATNDKKSGYRDLCLKRRHNVRQANAHTLPQTRQSPDKTTGRGKIERTKSTDCTSILGAAAFGLRDGETDLQGLKADTPFFRKQQARRRLRTKEVPETGFTRPAIVGASPLAVCTAMRLMDVWLACFVPLFLPPSPPLLPPLAWSCYMRCAMQVRRA